MISYSDIRATLAATRSIGVVEIGNALRILNVAEGLDVAPNYAVAILALAYKETGLKCIEERVVTPASRAMEVFKGKRDSKGAKLTLADWQRLTTPGNEVEYFDTIYGPGGYMYRGRGFNQLTFEGNYRRASQFINRHAKPPEVIGAASLDLTKNPSAVLEPSISAMAMIGYLDHYLGSSVARPTPAQKTGMLKTAHTGLQQLQQQNVPLEQALIHVLHANAGWGFVFDTSLPKMQRFAAWLVPLQGGGGNPLLVAPDAPGGTPPPLSVPRTRTLLLLLAAGVATVELI